jgi:FtsP/CotA-like multicopper oxidase with cupredoxin domain
MKRILASVLLQLVAVAAYAAPVQTILATTARYNSTPEFYGLELTLKLPAGVTPLFDTSTPGQNFIEPASVSLLNTSRTKGGAMLSASYQPAVTATDGDTVTIALMNSTGMKYGPLINVLCDLKPDFDLTYSSKTTNVSNVKFSIVNVKLFDINGSVIPYASANIHQTYVWK